jgi:predicted amino acid racemase
MSKSIKEHSCTVCIHLCDEMLMEMAEALEYLNYLTIEEYQTNIQLHRRAKKCVDVTRAKLVTQKAILQAFIEADELS